MAVFFSGRETACFEIQSTPLSFKVDDKIFDSTFPTRSLDVTRMITKMAPQLCI